MILIIKSQQNAFIRFIICFIFKLYCCSTVYLMHFEQIRLKGYIIFFINSQRICVFKGWKYLTYGKLHFLLCYGDGFSNQCLHLLHSMAKKDKQRTDLCAQSFLPCNKYTSCGSSNFFVFVMNKFNSSEVSRRARVKYILYVYWTRFSIWLSFLSTLSTTILECNKKLVTLMFKT